jgi:hypothetical protein
MADIDYGYGPTDDVDYGYGTAEPDDVDYGYGEAKPDDDYGYGEAKPDEDYGYGATTTTDYGYGDDVPALQQEQEPPRRKQVKRRCSVTKYSLEGSGATAVDLHTRIDEFRNATVPPAITEPQKDLEKVSTMTDRTSCASSTNDDQPGELPKKHALTKKSMMSRIRKRLSVLG